MTAVTSQPPQPSALRSPGSCLFALLFFGGFSGIGGIFLWLVAVDTWKESRPYFWTRAEAEIVASAVRDREPRGEEPYEFVVEYRYSAGGTAQTGTRWSTKTPYFGSYNAAHALVERFAPNTRAACFVNPTDPRDAVLERHPLWKGFFIVIPLVFVAIGIAGLWWTARGSPAGSGPAVPSAVSERVKAAGKSGCLRAFLSIFLVIGAFVCWSVTIEPLMQIRGARTWPSVPCTILSSRVVTHADSDSTTYSVDINYRYNVEGREYRSSRYRFESGSNSNQKEKIAIVRSHPPGAQTFAFVNPNNPNDAVLNREAHSGLWWGLSGLVFVAVGGAGCFYSSRSTKKGTRAVPLVHSALNGSVELKPKHTPLRKFLGTLAFFIVWNAFIGVFFHLVFLAEDSDRVPLFAKIIVGILSLVGVLALGGVFHSFLALFNPQLRLTANSAEIPLGGVLQLDWEIGGRADKFTKLRILLEGREEATYRRGTDTSTDTHVFIEIPLLESSDHAAFRSGSTQIIVPENCMHTFIAPNNKVLWRLRVEGEIARRPDVKDEYPITILPAS